MGTPTAYRRLDIYSTVQYLRVLGLAGDGPVEVGRLGARNSVFRAQTGDSDLVVKQFGESPADSAAFRREAAFHAECQAEAIVVSPVVVDDLWQTIVYPWSGADLGEYLRDRSVAGGVDSEEIASTVAHVLRQIPALSVRAPVVEPTVLAWLRGEANTSGMSLAQRRVLASVLAEPEVSAVVARASELWGSQGGAGFVHGDMKVEHVLLAGRSIRLVDWEYSRSGPVGWDHAGLIQSVLAHALSGRCDWSDRLEQLVGSLIPEGEIGQAECGLMVGLRLLQTAVEWEADGVAVSEWAGALAQAGFNLATGATSLRDLAGPHVG